MPLYENKTFENYFSTEIIAQRKKRTTDFSEKE